MRIPIPKGAWMRYRKGGRYVYAQNKPPIVWQGIGPPKGTKVYTIVWGDGQQSLLASGTIIME